MTEPRTNRDPANDQRGWPPGCWIWGIGFPALIVVTYILCLIFA